MAVSELWPAVLAALWGAAVGAFNNRLVAAPLKRLHEGVDARSPEGRAIVKAVARRYLLRLPLSMGALLLVFLVRRDPAVLVAALLGMLVPHAAMLAKELRLARRGTAGAGGG